MPKPKKTIEEYRAKRDFRKTPEPSPEQPLASSPDELQFVVHRHDATRLHYDLRLEMEGVLRSWAVPRGFSYNPEDKRLAVRTEDHPFAYLTFEGVIPKGEYGAGSMTIWDRGTYHFVNRDGIGGVGAGKVEIALRGRRLRGEWHLVLTKGTAREGGSPEDGSDEWLIFKARDLYARGSDQAVGGDLKASRPAPFPQSIAPMKPARKVRQAFSDPDWIFEMIFEGLRCRLMTRQGQPSLYSASVGPEDDLLPRLPELAKEAGKLRAENAWIDGVLVALDDTGRPSREVLAERLRGDGERIVQFYAFDLVHYEEFDLRPVPLIERKAQLASVIPPGRSLLYVDHVPGSGEGLVRIVEQSGLHGVMAKRADSVYASGRADAWVEIEVRPHETARKKDLSEALAPSGGEYAPTDARVKFTNLKKVYWPDQGFTKGDLLGYYEQVADFILPYLIDRPSHLLRYPDGVEGKSFYQHEAPKHLPAWFETIPIPSESKARTVPHMICNDRTSLLYLINLGSIDLHPWMSRKGSLDSPDWAVLDLDPKDAPFRDVIRVARVIKKILDAIGVESCLKTSGKSGLHIFIPLAPGYDYDQSRMFCEGIARVVVKDHGDFATIERATQNRKSRVYVDYMQNREGQTVVPPYVVRPVPEATVSTPLQWEELDFDLDPRDFHLRSVLPRLSRAGDLFRPALDRGQDLLPAIKKLQEYLKR
ncbi:MAG: non-homologous end-joining DNA ligase [Candidatus Eisenbacteria bacterium]